jgi:hypothetical protein
LFFLGLIVARISQHRQAAAIQKNLTTAQFYAATDSLQLLCAVSGIEAYAWRFFATRDRMDGLRLAKMIGAFDDSIQHIQDCCRSSYGGAGPNSGVGQCAALIFLISNAIVACHTTHNMRQARQEFLSPYSMLCASRKPLVPEVV